MQAATTPYNWPLVTHTQFHENAADASTKLNSVRCCSMAQVLKNHKAKWELVKGRKLTPVLAVGSNAAPAQLERKFPLEMFPDGVVIPVLRCVLPDFDVVYAPLISSYGSCTGECPYCNPLPPSTQNCSNLLLSLS